MTDTPTVEGILRKIRSISPVTVTGPDIYFDDLGDEKEEGFVVKLGFMSLNEEKDEVHHFRSASVLDSLLDCLNWMWKNPR